MQTRDYLLEQVHAFLKLASGPKVEDRVSANRLGMLVCGSPNLVSRLKSGKDVYTSTYDKTIFVMEEWYEDNGYYEEKDDVG